jgi:4-carboxymuconolactone decarboxylase
VSGGYDIDKRMDQILGQPQRIAPLAQEEMTEEALEISKAMRAAFKLPENGTIPDVFATMLVHPALFKIQCDIGMLIAATPAVPPRERELAVLRLAWLLGAPYEWGEHVGIGRNFGVTPEEIQRCKIGSAAPGWTEHERAIMKGVEELKDDCMISDETWATLAKTWDDKQMMEFPVLIGQYTSTAYQQNSLRMTLLPNNPGLSHG